VAGPTADEAAAPVRAAGGAVWRRDPAGSIEVVLVHRVAYDDWSLPKGKAERGESDEQTAVREVEEEAGVLCRLGPELPSTAYHDRYGRRKVVRYWAMTVIGGAVAGHHEVDDARWVSLPAARRRLTYERDVEVVDALEAALGGA
jgi:8-oxo-dGTP pyrophosphatase MutT (NUDIX family)